MRPLSSSVSRFCIDQESAADSTCTKIEDKKDTAKAIFVWDTRRGCWVKWTQENEWNGKVSNQEYYRKVQSLVQVQLQAPVPTDPQVD